MRVLLTGATGFIGGHLLKALLAEGHEVVAAVRRPHALPQRQGCTTLEVDFSRDLGPESWKPRLRGIEAVINCVGIIGEDRRQRFADLHQRGPIALFQACVLAGVRRVIQISALGADETAFSRYHLSKKAADDVLAATDLNWVIVQPSLVLGPGGASQGLFNALAALPITPLLGAGTPELQPIQIQDLVAVVLRLLAPGAPQRRRLVLAGPEVLTLGQILARLRGWLGRPPAPTLSIPFALALPPADVLGRWLATPFNGEALRMLRQGNTGDAGALTQLLGRPPLSLDQAMVEHPASSAERLEAAARFWLPLLRLTLAWLWIWSGLTSAFFFPRSESLALLAAVGISGMTAPLVLYGAAALDLVLGSAFLSRRWLVPAGVAQVLLMAGYSLCIWMFLPEFLLHPFAPVVKNLPLLIATMLVMAAREPQWTS